VSHDLFFPWKKINWNKLDFFVDDYLFDQLIGVTWSKNNQKRHLPQIQGSLFPFFPKVLLVEGMRGFCGHCAGWMTPILGADNVPVCVIQIYVLSKSVNFNLKPDHIPKTPLLMIQCTLKLCPWITFQLPLDEFVLFIYFLAYTQVKKTFGHFNCRQLKIIKCCQMIIGTNVSNWFKW